MGAPVSLIGVVLAGATIGIHLEDLEELSIDEALSIVHRLETELRDRGATVATDSLEWSRCERADRCLEEIRARTGAEEIVLVRVFRGPKNTHVVAERHTRQGRALEASIDLPNSGTVAKPLAELTARLFGDLKVSPATAGVQPSLATADDGASLWIYGLLGLTAAAGGASIGFGISSASANDQLQGLNVGSRAKDLADRGRQHGTASAVLVGVAAASLAVSLVVSIVD